MAISFLLLLSPGTANLPIGAFLIASFSPSPILPIAEFHFAES
jgi:hypothetical protein